jgi:hypothetical protein
MTWPCPWCGGPLGVAERQEGPVVRLAARCGPGRARIDAAGRDAADAALDLDRKVAARVGTRPEDWRIVPATGRRRTPRRR